MNKKYNILIVDDDKFITEIFSAKFRKVGIDTEVINIPDKDFVEQVVKIKPDLISLDILMPKISGFDAIQMLKTDPRTKDIPVIFLSNFSQEEEMKKGLALGAVDFFVTAFVIFDELINAYLGYLNNPEGYIKRYPVYLEVQKMKFSGVNDEEVNKKIYAYISKRFIELGIK
jgi:CheY-like chemotaxis protein